MPSPLSSPGPPSRTGRGDKALTFIERARREQLVGLTIHLIAEHGIARTSLQRIADSAGLSKAAVLYHFRTKNDVITAAYEAVRDAFVDDVAKDVSAAASPGAAVEAYLTGLLGYLARHPEHARLLGETLSAPGVGLPDREDTPARWQPFADLIARAQAAGEYDPTLDPRTHAIALGGAIDALAAESMTDADYSLDAATLGVVTLSRCFRRGPAGASADRTDGRPTGPGSAGPR